MGEKFASIARLKEAALWINENETYFLHIDPLVIRLSKTTSGIVIINIYNNEYGLGNQKAVLSQYIDDFDYYFNQGYDELQNEIIRVHRICESNGRK